MYRRSRIALLSAALSVGLLFLNSNAQSHKNLENIVLAMPESRTSNYMRGKFFQTPEVLAIIDVDTINEKAQREGNEQTQEEKERLRLIIKKDELERIKRSLSKDSSHHKCSDDYYRSVSHRVRSNIMFDLTSAPENPSVIFYVAQESNGEISRIELRKSSGRVDWDLAVGKALLSSSPLPKSKAGCFVRGMEIEFSPHSAGHN